MTDDTQGRAPSDAEIAWWRGLSEPARTWLRFDAESACLGDCRDPQCRKGRRVLALIEACQPASESGSA